jgi:hypothetical protein
MPSILKLLLFGVSVAAITYGIVIIVTTSLHPILVSYEGKLILNSTEEFSSFKDFVVSPNVQITGLKVSNSTPTTPTTVDYDLIMPVDEYFPYTYNDIDAVIGEAIGLSGVFSIIFGLFGAVFFGLLVTEDFV